MVLDDYDFAAACPVYEVPVYEGVRDFHLEAERELRIRYNKMPLKTMRPETHLLESDGKDR